MTRCILKKANQFLYWINFWTIYKTEKPLHHCTQGLCLSQDRLWGQTNHTYQRHHWQVLCFLFFVFFSLMLHIQHESPKALYSHPGTQPSISMLSACWQRGRDGELRTGSIKLLPKSHAHHLRPHLTGQGKSHGTARPECSQAGRYKPPAGKGTMGRKLECLVNRNAVGHGFHERRRADIRSECHRQRTTT